MVADGAAYSAGEGTTSVRKEHSFSCLKVVNSCEVVDIPLIASPIEVSTSSASKPPSSALPCALCDAAPTIVTDLQDIGKALCSSNAPDCPKLHPTGGGSHGATPVQVNVEHDVDAPLVCDGLPFTKYMIAGAVAGMTEHVAMFPVDTIKTRMQVTGLSIM